MPVELIAEYNTAVAEVQIKSLQILKRLLNTETEPKELRQLTAIAFRARTIADPSNPQAPRTRQARDQNRPAPRDQEADHRADDEPITSSPERATNPALTEALTTRIPPLRSGRTRASTAPIALMQAAASATALNKLAGAS
jgi:hypothetical protein